MPETQSKRKGPEPGQGFGVEGFYRVCGSGVGFLIFVAVELAVEVKDVPHWMGTDSRLQFPA